MAQIIQMTDVGFMTPGERLTAEHLEKSLPQSWIVVCNKEMVTAGGLAIEVDFIIIGTHRVFVAEEKAWRGRIHGDENHWVLSGGESRKSPVNKVSRVARQLAGKLRDTVSGLLSGLGEEHFVDGLVILSDPSAECRVTDPRSDQVIRLQDCRTTIEALDQARKDGSIKAYRDGIAKALHLLPDRPKIPRVIGNYEIEEAMPHGPYYRAFLARHAGGGPDAHRLLKVIQIGHTLGVATSARQKELVLREYHSLQALAETGLVPGVDHFIEWADGDFLVIPFHRMSGQSLRSFVKETKLDGRICLELARAAFTSLAQIHSTGILHRGLTPDCIHVLSTDPARVAFSDLHFARLPAEHSIAPTIDELEWLDPYRAPECRLGMELASSASDVFSLALCFCELITGTDIAQLTSFAEDRLRREPPSPANLRIQCSEALATDLKEFFECACNPDDKKRFDASGAAEHVADLVQAHFPVSVVASPPRPAPDTHAPESLLDNRFRVVKLLGRGMTGATYLVNDEVTGEQYAAKCLTDPMALKRWAVREFSILKNLHHPIVPRVYWVFEATKRVHLVRAYVPGKSLHDHAPEFAWPVERCLDVAEHLLDALDYLEKHYVAHRDLSPRNIVIDDSGRPHIIDFGLAKLRDEIAHSTVGTLLYRPPEVDSRGEWNTTCDTYALGVILFKMFTGEFPFLVEADRTDKTTLRSASQPTCPDSILRAVLKAVAPEPRERYGSASEFREALRQAITLRATGPCTVSGPSAAPKAVDALSGSPRRSARTRRVRADTSHIELTEEQKRIVAHDLGPAVVFAVAGSGKTTAAAYRIERLIREHRFQPRRILASSFGNLTVQEIKKVLSKWPHCSEVDVRSLHGVGRSIIALAQKHSIALELRLHSRDDDEGGAADLNKRILWETTKIAQKRDLAFKEELKNLDEDDFLAYVGLCKGNLQYADLAAAKLPGLVRNVATQAVGLPGTPWYLDLYRLYEHVRLKQMGDRGLVTFDDMLLTGWELLIRHPTVLGKMRGRYDCVIVDEFQDVNLAQSEILDLLTEPHRNYMVIGDDDQTIYEWRGASTRFILEFAKHYGAENHEYPLTENFRSKAAHVALANEVIKENKNRKPKHLVLTQGFDGDSFVHMEDDESSMGRNIAVEIKSALDSGIEPKDIVILVRLYAQTPCIEQQLTELRIPHRIVGNVPFYERNEVRLLINYLTLGLIEHDLISGQALGDDAVADFSECWKSVYNRPTRYLRSEIAQNVRDDVVDRGSRLNRSLEKRSSEAKGSAPENMRRLAGDMRWVAGVVRTQPADQVLAELASRLKYKDFLKAMGGFQETVDARIATVDALIQYASGYPTAVNFVDHLRWLRFGRVGRERDEDAQNAVRLMSIHKAKGLQWPIVFVPHCNQDWIPFSAGEIEEERRLFYVAITRPQQQLHLHVLRTTERQPRKISQFLVEAKYQSTLDTVKRMRSALEQDPATWRAEHSETLARDTRRLHFDRYFRNWWNAPAQLKNNVVGKLRRFFRFIRDKALCPMLGISLEDETLWSDLETTQVTPIENEFAELIRVAPKPERKQVSSATTEPQESRPQTRRDEPVPTDAKGNPVRIGDRIRWSLYGEATIQEIAVTDGTVEFLIQMDNGEVHVVDPKYVFPVNTTNSRDSVRSRRRDVSTGDDAIPF